jgi:hypothetical protein
LNFTNQIFDKKEFGRIEEKTPKSFNGLLPIPKQGLGYNKTDSIPQ